jgi:hypothetical protein
MPARRSGLCASILRALSTLIVAIAVTPAMAATQFYVHTFEANSRLFVIDADAGTSSLIGSTGINSSTDLALGPDGKLFAATLSQLYQLDRGTGAATLVGSLGASNIVGLDFTPSGNLYGVGQSGGFYSINSLTAFATPVFNAPFTFVGDIASSTGNTFYATANFADGSHLIQIDASASSAVDRGLIASGVALPGLDFDSNGTLFAFSTTGEVLEIPGFPSSAAGVHLSNTGIAMAGATFVLEPALLSILVIAGFPLSFRRPRRRGRAS